MTDKPANLAERLAAEIRRVSELRGQYASLDGTPGVNVKPALLFIDRALDQGQRAAGGAGGIEAMVVAVRELAGFTS